MSDREVELQTTIKLETLQSDVESNAGILLDILCITLSSFVWITVDDILTLDILIM